MPEVARFAERLNPAERRAAIQRGELPAETIEQLVDAQRQDLAGLGIVMTFSLDDLTPELYERIRVHVRRLDQKATMAFSHARRR